MFGHVAILMSSMLCAGGYMVTANYVKVLKMLHLRNER